MFSSIRSKRAISIREWEALFCFAEMQMRLTRVVRDIEKSSRGNLLLSKKYGVIFPKLSKHRLVDYLSDNYFHTR